MDGCEGVCAIAHRKRPDIGQPRHMQLRSVLQPPTCIYLTPIYPIISVHLGIFLAGKNNEWITTSPVDGGHPGTWRDLQL